MCACKSIYTHLSIYRLAHERYVAQSHLLPPFHANSFVFFLRALDVAAAATAAEKTAVTHSKLLSHCAPPSKLELSISVAVVVVEYHM